MTRINVVPVEELCDQHLFAEFRELTRIPNGIASGKLQDKLAFLKKRYCQLHKELLHRSYDVTFIWPDDLPKYAIWNDYVPDDSALWINRERINERMPEKARWTNRKFA